ETHWLRGAVSPLRRIRPTTLQLCAACVTLHVPCLIAAQVAILEKESELMDLKYQLEQERTLRVKAEQDKKKLETRLRRLTELLLEKQRVVGVIYPHPPSSSPHGDMSMQPHLHSEQQQEQLEAIARERREVYSSVGAKGATFGQQQQQPQQNQHYHHHHQPPEPSGLSAERPPTPPQHPST
ncbi:hypothetical protein DUNSADRAFT_8285, partial [Dunaliella salina]